MTAAAASRARMNRPVLDAERLRRRTEMLAALLDCHRDVYVARCARQGWPKTTTPSELARHEIANEMTGEG